MLNRPRSADSDPTEPVFIRPWPTSALMKWVLAACGEGFGQSAQRQVICLSLRVQCATIITCPPNDLMEPLHNRMPVILSREAESLWLDPLSQDRDVRDKFLGPNVAEETEARGLQGKSALGGNLP